MIDKLELNIWGRPFDLKVAYDCYENESVSEIQLMSLTDFITKSSTLLYDYSEVMVYCIKRNKEQITSDNIFKYVIPTTLYVPRNRKNTIALLCNYRFDLEHGIAIVFEENKILKIVSQDDIL